MKNIFTRVRIKKVVFVSIFLILLFSILYFTNSYFKQITTDIQEILTKVIEIINYPILTLWNTSITISNIGLFLFIIYIWVKLAGYYKVFIYKIRKKYNNNLSYSTTTLLANMGYYTIITIVFLASARVIWIDLSNLTIIAWALSVWIWFWLQNIVSNFVSGIILMFEKSIKIWDYIELSDGTSWTILDIKMRSVTIKTNNNIDIIIPNQKFIENNIVNWTLNDKKVRFKIPFWVAYWTKIKDVEKIILTSLSESGISHLKSWDYKPLIIMTDMASSSVNFELYVWIKGDEIVRPNRTKSEFLKMIYTALNENWINIPFPQTDLHIKDSVPIEIKINNN